MERKQLEELLLQALTHEKGGVNIYRTALRCVIRPDLRQEWTRYLEQTERHVVVLRGVCDAFRLDPDTQLPCCKPVEHAGRGLVETMEIALRGGDPEGAQRVACDCVVLAETKDHAHWELLSKCVPHLESEERRALEEAVDEVEAQEDEHLYHSKGWGRELALEALGLPAVLPPPEETRDVRSATEAARVEKERSAAAKA
ncbi:MAG: hypothetical protein J0L92_08245 [Deltaproteobacteria bacterium]|nr:hypothetical protein [Deltaproteobacteria bacterium]